MSATLDDIRRKIAEAREDAQRVYEANKKTASGESIVYDAGRVEGLKQALEIITEAAA